MKYVSLFAGIGGFEIALNKLGHECVYANEWDLRSAEIYERNIGHKPDTRDLTTVGADEIPDHELLVGGFPCQAFSGAGYRKGFNDTRGTLFFDIARIVKKKRPRYLLLENVSGLLTHEKGRTFKTILSVLEELGYDCEWLVFDSWLVGAAPRKRVYIKGIDRQYKIHALQGDKQALSSYADLCEKLVNENHTTRNEELGRASSRIIRTFAGVPSGMDSWDALYEEEVNDRKRSHTNGS